MSLHTLRNARSPQQAWRAGAGIAQHLSSLIVSAIHTDRGEVDKNMSERVTKTVFFCHKQSWKQHTLQKEGVLCVDLDLRLAATVELRHNTTS